jgi:tetratricopeptide (TPR) repeat protein
VVAVYDRTFLAGSFGRALRRRWVVYLLLAGTWGILAALVTGRGASAGFGYGVSPWDYARTQLGVILRYLRLSVWPGPLCLDYGWPIADSPGEILPGAVVIGLLLAATAWALWRKPAWGFLGAWLFLILAPTSSIVPIKDVAFEHRMYLPLAAIVAAGVFAAYLGWQRLAAVLGGRTARAFALSSAPVLLVGVVAALGYRTVVRNRDFASDVAIWEDTIAKVPRNVRARTNLALAHCFRGDYRSGLKQYAIAIELDPDCSLAYNGRGNCHRELGDHDAAIRDFSEAIRLKSDYATAYANRGNVYERLGQYERAIDDHNAAIDLDPDVAATHTNRGNVYARLGKHDLAMRDHERAIALDPHYAVAYANRANVYSARGEHQAAIDDCNRALALDPHLAGAYYNRGNAWLALGDHSKAVADYTHAVRLDRTHAQAYNNRGAAHRRLGRLHLAVADYTAAIAINPKHVNAYANRGNVHQQLGQYEQAIADYTKAIELRGEQASVYYNRAVCHFYMKRYARAWDDIETFRKLGGTPNPQFLQALAAASPRPQ